VTTSGKVFFHHLAKVGGGSVRTILADWQGKALINEVEYGGHEALSDEVVHSITSRKFFKVLFLRDPIDRFVSAFNFYSTYHVNIHIPAWNRHWIKLRGDYLQLNYDGDINRMIEEENAGRFAFLFDPAIFPHFTPIKDQYKDMGFYDFVGRTETLSRDILRLADALGVDRSSTPDDIRANVSPRLVTRADVTEQNIEILKTCFAREYDDLEKLG